VKKCVSQEEKKFISSKVGELNFEQLCDLIAVVHKSNPELVEDTNEENITLRVDIIDTETYEKIKK
jgi:hypothetical protein